MTDEGARDLCTVARDNFVRRKQCGAKFIFKRPEQQHQRKNINSELRGRENFFLSTRSSECGRDFNVCSHDSSTSSKHIALCTKVHDPHAKASLPMIRECQQVDLFSCLINYE